MSLLFACIVLYLLALASPLPTISFHRRAGGPIGAPVPAQCATPEIKPALGGESFKPTSDFTTSSQIYSYYVPSDDQATDDQAGFRQCLDSCYGFGSTGECKSILWAHDVTYTVRGSTGKGTACVFFSAKHLPSTLEGTADGSYADAHAVNIDCP